MTSNVKPPAIKLWIENVLRFILRVPLFQHWATMLFHLAQQNPNPVTDARYLRQDLLDLIARTDLRDPELQNYNETRRAQRAARGTEALRINWIIPDVTAAGSGGHMNVFRFIEHLQARGHKNRVFPGMRSHFKSLAAMTEYLRLHYVPMEGVEFFMDSETLPASDICVATGWETAYRVHGDRGALFKLYFIQDFEPYFFHMGSYSIFAENTYKMNFAAMCGSPWLAQKVSAEYGMSCSAFEFGYDPTLYHPLTDVQRDPDRVCVYVRLGTPRRGFELLMAALADVKRIRPKTKIALFGHGGHLSKLPFECDQIGVLRDDGLARLYNESAILLVASLTNYSIIPVEAMACGALVVDLKRPSIESVFKHGENIVLSDPDPLSIARSLVQYLDDGAERAAIAGRGQKLAAGKLWPAIFADMEKKLLDAFRA